MEQIKINENGIYIKYVAIYLRKSRGDLDKDLVKHKKVLEDMCKSNDWKYVLYEEVSSGESIAMRPIMQRLLKDVLNDVYDAVLVMDIDRLGRGDMGDQDKINKAFSKSETFVVTEKEIYNLNDDDDEFIIDMKGFIARREYKEIVKRLVRGKKVGARMGMWTNGKPPFPYEYERWKDKFNEKGLVVNDDKYKIYRYIIDSLITHKIPPNDIAYELNKQKIPAPRGGKWHGVTVYRILIDLTHLGKIISNKTKGDGHVNKKPSAKEYTILPKSEWIIVDNCHQAVKSQEEHEKILIFLNRIKKTPKRSVAKKLPFTGLIKCANCGHTMMLQERKDRNGALTIKPCWYRDPVGNKCGNRGGSLTIIYDIVNTELEKYEERIKHETNNSDGEDVERIKNMMENQQKLIMAKEKAITRIQEAYEGEIYSLEEYKKRKEIVAKEIDALKDEFKILELRLKHTSKMTNEERINIIHQFKETVKQNDLSYAETNEVYKSIIESIVWKREGDNIDIEVNFL